MIGKVAISLSRYPNLNRGYKPVPPKSPQNQPIQRMPPSETSDIRSSGSLNLGLIDTLVKARSKIESAFSSLTPLKTTSQSSDKEHIQPYESVREVVSAYKGEKISKTEMAAALLGQPVIVIGRNRPDGFHPFILKKDEKSHVALFSSTQEAKAYIQNTTAKLQDTGYRVYSLQEAIKNLPQDTGAVLDTRSGQSFILEAEDISKIKAGL